MLMKFPLPYYVGMSPAYTNAGDMSNKGWEVSVSHKNKLNDFTYGVTFTLSDNRNKITNLNGLNSQDKTMVEGYPNKGIWGYVTDGYYKDWDDVNNSPKLGDARPGFVKYVKVYQGEDSDPMTIDTRDMVYLGDPFPHFEYGVTLNAGWKNFDFTAFFQGVGQRVNYMSGVGLKPLLMVQIFSDIKWIHGLRTIKMQHTRFWFLKPMQVLTIKNLINGYETLLTVV